jgi:Right handed beta helix region
MSSRLERPARRRRPPRMRVEALEARELLAIVINVTTTADSGPGSLRQAIVCADAQTSASSVSIAFNLPTNDPGYNASKGVWTISVQSPLPALTEANLTIDGTTQPGFSKSKTLGTGGTVGVDALTLSKVAIPVVQIVDALPNGGVPVGFNVQSVSATIQGLAISGFGSVPNDPNNANILVSAAASGTVIKGDFVGLLANGSAPLSPYAAVSDGIEAVGSGSGTIKNSLIESNQGNGVELSSGSNGWVVQGNEIRGNGVNSGNLGGIDVDNGSGNETITGNLLTASWASGIDSYQSSGGNQIVDNTITNNGIGTFSSELDAGIRLNGSGSLVKSNAISGNFGAGVMVASGSMGDTITLNSISGNGTIANLAGASPTGEVGINLLTPSDSVSQGTYPFVTPNDPSSTRDGINGLVNFPVFTSTQIQNGQLTVAGFARPGAVLELYLANSAPNGFGQGQTFLGSFTVGSSADLGTGTGTYGPTVNGVLVGSDTTHEFQFSIPTPLTVSNGSYVTATATQNGSTSEFGPQSQVVGVSGPLTYKSTSSVSDGLLFRQLGTNFEIDDNGIAVAREPVTLATSIQIQGNSSNTSTLSVSVPGAFADSLSLSNFLSTSIRITGNLSGQIIAPSTPIQSLMIVGNVTSTASIIAGSFPLTPNQTAPVVLITGDLGGTVQAIENLAVPGSGVLGSIEINGNVLASTGQIKAGSIGSILVEHSLNGSVLAQGAGTIGTVTVDGNLTGTVSAPEDPNPGSGTITSVSVTGSLSGTVSTGDLTGVTVGGDLTGTVIAQGAGTIGTVTVDGNLTGTVSAPEDPNPGSGTITSVSVTGSLSGTVSTGDLTGVTVGGDLTGTVIAQGAGTIGTVTVDGNLTGTVSAPEDPNPGSGTISMVTVTGSLTGTVSTGDLTGVAVGGDLTGTVIAQGAGTIGTVTVDGNLTGTVSAPEDPNPGSGTITSVSVTGSLSGTVSTGDLTGVTVGGDLTGTVIAQGAGTIGTVTVDGNLTGTVSAPEDPNPGSGTIGMVTVTGSLTGTVSTGDLTGVTVGGDLTGTVIAQGAGHIGTAIILGNLGVNGKLEAILDSNSTSGEIDSVTIDKTVFGLIEATGQIETGVINTVGSTGSIQAGNVTKSLTVSSSTGSITANIVATFVGSQVIGGTVTIQSVTNLSVQTVTGTFVVANPQTSGTINVAVISSTGSLTASSPNGTVTIGSVQGTANLGNTGAIQYQSLMAGSVITASSITRLTILNNLAGTVDVSGNLGTLIVKGNMSGQVNVGGTLGAVSVAGGTPGSFVAGHVGTISEDAGLGPVVLQVTENGIERQLVATTASSSFSNAPPSNVFFRYYYESDSGLLANPQLSVQVSNQSGSFVPDQFDLSLITDNDAAKFNLALLDAVGVSGIRNINVEGDLLTSESAQSAQFLVTDPNLAGIQLPFDKLAGVEVRDFIPYGGYIKAASIQAISAGLIGQSGNQSVMGALASPIDAQNLLAPGTQIVQANDTFRVPFADLTNLQVGFFLDDTSFGGFDASNVAFTVQSVVAANAAGTANVIAQSNAARGADVALIAVGNLLNNSSQIQGINILGDGASISTQQWVNGPITSSGSLGDLSLLNSQPVGNITASSIFGTISTNAPIAGTIQTTGLRTDPITGAVSSVPADFGRVYLDGSMNLTPTVLTVNGGPFAGRLIVRGNLLAGIVLNGGLSGLIAAQGNIGSVFNGSTRTGGVKVNGPDSGSILSLGQIIGDVTVNGGLSAGSSIAGEAGILGNTTINGGIASGASVVSEGDVGSTTYGTALTVNGNVSGLIACNGNLILAGNPPSPSNTISNAAGTPNAAAIDAIFTVGTDGLGAPELFDSTPGSLDLLGLNEILTDLANLHIGKNGQLTVVPGA